MLQHPGQIPKYEKEKNVENYVIDWLWMFCSNKLLVRKTGSPMYLDMLCSELR